MTYKHVTISSRPGSNATSQAGGQGQTSDSVSRQEFDALQARVEIVTQVAAQHDDQLSRFGMGAELTEEEGSGSEALFSKSQKEEKDEDLL